MNIPLIFAQSFWRDEAFSALIAVKPPWEIILSLVKDQSPPLYFLFLHYWIQLFGTSEYMIRLLSMFWYIGLVIVVYLIAGEYIRNWLGRAVIAAAVFLNPLLIQYAAEARPYMMYTFLTTLGVYLLIKKKYIFSGIMFGLASLTHNFGLFNLFAVFCWWIYTYRVRLKESLIDGAKFFLPAGLLSMLWVGITLLQFNRITGAFWITEKTFNMFSDMLQMFTKGEIWHESHAAVYIISLMLIVVGVSYFIAPRKKVINELASLAISISIIPILMTYVISHFSTPIYHDRYLLASLPMWIIGVSYGVTRLWEERRVVRWGLAVLIIVFFYTTFTSVTQIMATSIKPPINWAVREALSKASPGDVIISEDVINFLEVKWYAHENAKHIPVHTVFQGEQFPYFIGISAFDSGDVLSSLPAGNHIWVVQIDGGLHEYVPGETLSTGQPQ